MCESELQEASDLATPAERLSSLARHDEDEVRIEVACNPRTSVETLTLLADDPVVHVRAAVAVHVKSPVSLHEQLSLDPDPPVRRDVASNLLCPPEILAWLSEDDDCGVRQEAAANRATPLASLLALEDDGPETLESLFSNGSYPEERIERYAFADEPDVRLLAAASGRLDSNTLHYLAHDQDARVRLAVAADPATPVEALHHLLEEGLVRYQERTAVPDLFTDPAAHDWHAYGHSDAIQVAVAENSSMPPELLQYWLTCDEGEEAELQLAIRERLAATDDVS